MQIRAPATRDAKCPHAKNDKEETAQSRNINLTKFSTQNSQNFPRVDFVCGGMSAKLTG